MPEKARGATSYAAVKTIAAKSATPDIGPELLLKAISHSATDLDQIVQRRIGLMSGPSARRHAK